MDYNQLWKRAADLKDDVEVAIAKIIMKNKDVAKTFNLSIEENSGGHREIYYLHLPLRLKPIEETIALLENLVNFVENTTTLA